MPIIELSSDTFVQSCAVCSGKETVEMSEALPEDTGAGDHLIRLPTCRNCGAVELLIPLQSDPDDHPEPGSYGHLHRLLVEELDERLTPSRADAARTAKRAKWFPSGFNLPAKFKPADVADKEERS